MIQLTDFSHFNVTDPRYLHNMVIHFPIGACGIIILFLIYVKLVGNQASNSQTILFLTTITVIFCWMSVVAGHITAGSAGYMFLDEKWLLENKDLGHIVLLHRFFGFFEATIMTIILLFTYLKHKKKQFNANLILVLHLINFIIISITGHLGASIGHL